MGGSALAGGIGAEIAGGNFWDGARNGAISAGLNHAIHTGVFGDGLMMSAITGRTRHLFGPDAISLAGTVDASSGVALGLEKGGLIILRGKEAGIYSLNDLGAGVGGVSVSAGMEIIKLYTSAKPPVFRKGINYLKLYYLCKKQTGKLSKFNQLNGTLESDEFKIFVK